MGGLGLGFGQKPSSGSISGSIQTFPSEQKASGSISGSIQRSQSISESIGTLLLRAISAGSIRGSIQAFFQSTEALWIDPWIDPKPPRSIGNNRIDWDPTVASYLSRRRELSSTLLHRFISDLHQLLHSSSQARDRQFLKVLGGSSKSRGGSKQGEETRVRVCALIVSL